MPVVSNLDERGYYAHILAWAEAQPDRTFLIVTLSGQRALNLKAKIRERGLTNITVRELDRDECVVERGITGPWIDEIGEVEGWWTLLP